MRSDPPPSRAARAHLETTPTVSQDVPGTSQDGLVSRRYPSSRDMGPTRDGLSRPSSVSTDDTLLS
eukprot:1614417-Prymnesium_polylepis.1